MSFKDRGWNARFEQLGDEAEGIFEEVATQQLKLGYVRYGLNRPPIQMSRLPARIRYSPDYLMSAKFVEVQGFGRDQLLKLKIDKWMSLHFWNSIHPVELFAWDTTNNRWCFVTLDDLDLLIADGMATFAAFPERKSYLAFEADALFEASDRVGIYEVQDADAA